MVLAQVGAGTSHAGMTMLDLVPVLYTCNNLCTMYVLFVW